MPRLFTAIEVPAQIGQELSLIMGGLPGARWIEAASYHVTLRFLGDIDHSQARDVADMLEESRRRGPFRIELEALATFGGDRPRALIAKVTASAPLTRLQAEHEAIARRAGLTPETRKFTPHVTLARLRGVTAPDAAAFIARSGHFPTLSFEAERSVLFSARDSVGGGPYVAEAAYPLREGAEPPPPEEVPFDAPASWLV